jgi:hypothetical protein
VCSTIYDRCSSGGVLNRVHVAPAISRHRATPRKLNATLRTAKVLCDNLKGFGMSDRSLIFNAKGAQIGYVEGSRAFDLRGRERCNYARATGNLTDLNGEKIVGYVSLDGTFVGLSWISVELFGKPSGEVHPDRAFAKKRQRPKEVNMQQPQKSNAEQPKDVPSPTATVPQLENPIEHSPTTEPGGDPENVSNASEKVVDEAPVPHREPAVSAQNSTNPSSTQDELVGRAIGMIRSALESGSA